MSWADRELESIENTQYAARDRAKVSHPDFVVLADKVLHSLDEGIKKLAIGDWFIHLDPGLALETRRSFGRAEPQKNFNVTVDYPNLSFVVVSTTHATWRNLRRTVTPSLLGSTVTEEQVDKVTAEVIGDFVPHFRSLTFVLR